MPFLDPFSSTANGWITCPYPNPDAAARLFAFPHAGSGTAAFQGWAEFLSPNIELCPVRLPAREGRIKEAPYTRLAPLVEALGEALLVSLDKPFALFGHSLGAIVCFELARYLRRQHGLTPVHLFASGSNAPHQPEISPPLHHLPDALFLEKVRQRFNGIPEIIWQNRELMELFLPTLRADITLLETYVYRYEPPFTIPISAFAGDQDAEVSPEGLAAWSEQTTASFRLQWFHGDHFYLQGALPNLLEAVQADLARSLSLTIATERGGKVSRRT